MDHQGARLPKISQTFDMTRQFLVDHIQRIIYQRSGVTIIGSVPVKRGAFQAAVPNRKAIRGKPHKLLPDDGRWKKLKQVRFVLANACARVGGRSRTFERRRAKSRARSRDHR
jgi:hypothetical protein